MKSTTHSLTVPFYDLTREHESMRSNLHGALDAALDGDSLILGNSVRHFETRFAHAVDVEHVVGVGSGADAIELILRALELGPEDEVIVPAHTFFASASAVVASGAKLVLCDVGPDGLINPADVAKRITERTRVIMPVHLYGQCADVDAIADLCARRKIMIVEDACQAFGATYKRCPAGSLGRAAAFSFYPTKNLGALGDGGAVATNDAALAAKVRLLRNYGSAEKYLHQSIGRNSRLDSLQATMLLVKLDLHERAVAARRRWSCLYREALAETPLTLLAEHEHGTHAHHLFVVRVDSRATRQALVAHLADRGIGTQVHYPVPLHLQPALADRDWGALPVATEMADTVLSLPLYPRMTEAEVMHVVQGIRDFYATYEGVAT